MGSSQINGKLYNLGSYPGVRLGGEKLESWVQGEVYQITAELERQLDEIEEVWPQQTREYAKREVVVQCAGQTLVCLVYEAAEAHTQEKKLIECGDWVGRELAAR